MKLPRVPLLSQVSVAHLVSHLHIMALPAVLPLLPGQLDVGFLELGLAISVFNIVSALVQAPLGFAVDRFGARRVLIFGLLLGSSSFLSLGLFPGYAWLLVAMGLAGFANGVYHPANYALLSTGIDERRMGRAFSVHTFAGYLGAAMAPGMLLGIAAWQGTRLAFAAAGLAGFMAVALLSAPSRASPSGSAELTTGSSASPESQGGSRRSRRGRGSSVLTPAIFALTFLFILLSLSGTSIQNFSVSALVSGYDVPLALANGGLTAYLFASALGVLAGGALADRTRHHGTVAATALVVAALLVGAVALSGLQGVLLVAALGLAGFLFGLIAPSRDMLVRAAAPIGAEGRVFGIVSTGFNIGGAVGPVLFGWLLDSGRPQGIFWAAVAFMLFTAVISLLQERRTADGASPATAATAGGEPALGPRPAPHQK